MANCRDTLVSKLPSPDMVAWLGSRFGTGYTVYDEQTCSDTMIKRNCGFYFIFNLISYKQKTTNIYTQLQ